MTMTRRRYTGIGLVKAKLQAEGRIEAFDAVYHLTDPDGTPHRITRLAAVIHTLRHKYGWVIDTETPPGMLARYILRSSDGPVARREPAAPECPVVGCDRKLEKVTSTLDPRIVIGTCPNHGVKTVRR